jgi:hypothetical protein
MMNLLVLIFTVYFLCPEKFGAPAIRRGRRYFEREYRAGLAGAALGPYSWFTRAVRVEMEVFVLFAVARLRSSG